MGVLLARVALAVLVLAVAFPAPALAGCFGHCPFVPFVATQTITPGVPSGVDPRFGVISFQPSFGLPGPVHPAFQTQPIIIQQGQPQPIVVPPGATLVCVPGQWFWSGWQWVWLAGHCVSTR